jgi:hypothetical protein
MLRAALAIGLALGFNGSSGLGSVGLLRVNMKGPRGLFAPLAGKSRWQHHVVVELCQAYEEL